MVKIANVVDTKMAKILRQARVDAGLTQDEVAQFLGVARWTYHRAETGRRDFSSDWVTLLPLEMQQPVAAYLETVSLAVANEMGKIRRRRIRRPTGAVMPPPAAVGQPVERRNAA